MKRKHQLLIIIRIYPTSRPYSGIWVSTTRFHGKYLNSYRNIKIIRSFYYLYLFSTFIQTGNIVEHIYYYIYIQYSLHIQSDKLARTAFQKNFFHLIMKILCNFYQTGAYIGLVVFGANCLYQQLELYNIYQHVDDKKIYDDLYAFNKKD